MTLHLISVICYLFMLALCTNCVVITSTFDIFELQTIDTVQPDISASIGELNGNLGVSSNKVFVSGTSGTISIDKSTLNMGSVNVVSGAAYSYSIITNLANQQLYALGDLEEEFIIVSGDVTCLIPLSATSGLRDVGPVVWLSEPIYMEAGSIVFSGYDQFFVTSPSTHDTYSISLLDGAVEQQEDLLHRWQQSHQWMSWGILERTVHHEDTTIYAAQTGKLEVQGVNAASSVDSPWPFYVGESASLGVDASTGRWYAVYAGSGVFGTSSAQLGSAPFVELHFAPTSQPSTQPSSQPTVEAHVEVFDILDLTSLGATSVDVSSYVGDFHGSVALSSDRVFVVGSEGTVGFPKDDLSSASPVLVTGQNHTLVTNLATQEIYALGDASGKFLQDGGLLECLIPLDPDTALRAPQLRTIWLTEAILLSVGSSVLSGYHRLVVVDGDTRESYAIQMQNGEITELGPVLARQALSNDKFQGGVLSHTFQGEDKLLYTGPAGDTEHQYLDEENLVTNRMTGLLGSTSSFTLQGAGNDKKWYFYSEDGGSLLQTMQGLGYANYTLLDSAPSSQPSSQPSSYPTMEGNGEFLFDILALTDQNVEAVDVSALVGQYVSNIAVSAAQVFFTGSNGLYGLPKDDLSSQTVTEVVGA